MSDKITDEWLSALADDAIVRSSETAPHLQEARLIRNSFIKKNDQENFNISIDGLNKIFQAASAENLLRLERPHSFILEKISLFLKVTVPICAAVTIFAFVATPDIVYGPRHGYQIASLTDPTILGSTSMSASSAYRSLNVERSSAPQNVEQTFLFEKRSVSSDEMKKIIGEFDERKKVNIASQWLYLFELDTRGDAQEVILDARLLTGVTSGDLKGKISIQIYDLSNQRNNRLRDMLSLDTSMKASWFITVDDVGGR